MTRSAQLLSVLGFVLVLVLFYLFAWQPKADEITALETQIETTIGQQDTTSARILSLEDVRANAPEIEASLARAESIIPREAGLPSAIRQLQLAADDSGVTLQSIAPGRPTVASPEAPDLAGIDLSVQLRGGYFQVVDFLRRIEDPAITPRGVLWTSTAVAPADYPTLDVTLTGAMFAVVDAAAGPGEETPAGNENEDAEESVDDDAAAGDGSPATEEPASTPDEPATEAVS